MDAEEIMDEEIYEKKTSLDLIFQLLAMEFDRDRESAKFDYDLSKDPFTTYRIHLTHDRRDSMVKYEVEAIL